MSPVATQDDWGGYRRPPMPERKDRLRFQLLAGMIGVDLLAMLFGFLTANLLRFGTLFAEPGLELAKVLIPVFLVIAVNSDAYSIKALVRYRYGLGRLLTALALTLMVVSFVVFYLHVGVVFSRLTFSLGIAACVIALTAGRVLYDRVARYVYFPSPVSTVLIHHGETPAAEPGILLVDAEVAGLIPDDTDPMMLDRLGRFLKHADRVIVACTEERRVPWAMALKGANIRGEIIDPEIARLGALGTGRYGNAGTLLVSSGALGVRDRIAKRALDLCLAFIGVIGVLPILAIAAIAIKLDDGGPILFVQQRLGRGNRLFNMYKFRSMKVAQLDHSGNRSASRDDDRITRVGKWIRKSSIDELPQILNILEGNMSFVGPRPHALGSLAGDQLFWEVDQRYWHRHATKPGLTGLAQVRGFRGATLKRTDLIDRLQADLEYLTGWTLFRDIHIILATFRVLIHRNAF